MSKTIADFFPTAQSGRDTVLTDVELHVLQEMANDISDEYVRMRDRADDLLEEHANLLPQFEGMYRNPETDAIYRVKENRAGTNMYAYILRGSSWEYCGGLARNGLRETHRMTVEECDTYSVHIGQCCMCGKTLTNLKSVGFGMGPVCRKRQARRY